VQRSIRCHLKWFFMPIVNQVKYLRELSLYWLTTKAINEKPLIKKHQDGLAPSYERPLCLFCSHDEKNIIKKSVFYYLNELKQAGFDIIFISTSNSISEDDLEKLSSSCIKIISRENRGYDFYGWKTGLEQYPQYNLHAGLLLANDSVIGPLFDIRDIVTRLENCDADIIGMTNCFQVYPHLQSYFLYCKKCVVLSEEFTRFFQWIQVIELKIAIIRKYEIGFSRLLGRRFRLMALYDLRQLVAQVGYHERPIKWLDPFFLWKPLITQFKFPFLKKSLFSTKKIKTAEIPTVIRQYTTYNLDILPDWFPPRSKI
jgi:lipopolysaccharide biosynthesis protein